MAALLRFPVASQLGPILQALPDLALKTSVGWIVKRVAAERFRKVVLAGEGIRRVVVVFVAASIAFRLHQLGRRIEDMLWRQQRAGLLCRAHRGPKGLV